MTKIISLLLSILLWFVVLNINDPFAERRIFVELTIMNENQLARNNLYLVNTNYRRTVELVVRGRQKVLSELSSDDFEIILDFGRVDNSGYKSVPLQGPVFDRKDSQITITSMIPREITIDLEDIVSKELPVEVSFTGVPLNNYLVVNAVTEPEYISLSDRASLINEVSKLKAIIDISNLDRDKKVVQQPCIAFNEEGAEIPQLSNKFTIDVILDVGKEVNIETSYTGNPSEDFIITGFRPDRNKAIIAGPYSIVSAISTIKSENVNVENINTSGSYEVPLILPEGVTLVSQNKTINVMVDVERLREETIIINKNMINIENARRLSDFTPEETDGGIEYLKYDILDNSVELIVKGRTQDIELLLPSMLTPHIDVDELNEGIYALPLLVNERSNIQIVSIPQVNVEITRVRLQSTNDQDPDDNGVIEEPGEEEPDEDHEEDEI